MSNDGKKVKVHYVGTLDDGTKFDSSRDRGEPLAFTCMAGQMIKGFDEAVREMEVGQVVDVRLEPAEAYGERDERLVQTVPVAQMPGAENLSVGDRVMLTSPMGQPFPAVVAAVEDGNITFDMNHEMAGKAQLQHRASRGRGVAGEKDEPPGARDAAHKRVAGLIISR